MFKDSFDSFLLFLVQVENRVFVDRCFLFSSFSFFFFLELAREGNFTGG